MGSQSVRPPAGSANVFINYRREDSSGHAGRLFDALSGHLPGRLFMDIDTLDPGVDFVEAIEQAVSSCEVLIVVIGREWLNIKSPSGHRRLDDPADFVRLELESALARKIRVIPVLVQGAPMPGSQELPPSLAALARRNAIEISDARWAYDVDRLARTIQDILGKQEASAPASAAATEKAPLSAQPASPAPRAKAAARSKVWLLAAGAAVVVAAVVVASVLGGRRTTSDHQVTDPAPRAATPSPATGDPTGGRPTAESSKSPTPVSQPTTKVPPVTLPRVQEPAKRPAKIPVLNPVKKTTVAPPHNAEPSEPIKTSATGPGTDHSEPAAILQPAQATITSPASGEKVGPTVQVQGTVVGQLGDQRIFLCIRQGDRKIYPRGELFPKAGQWTIQLRSSKEKTFEILVVATSNKEAAQVLSDQTSRDHGIAVLPPGASISSPAIAVKRQGKLSEMFNPNGP